MTLYQLQELIWTIVLIRGNVHTSVYILVTMWTIRTISPTRHTKITYVYRRMYPSPTHTHLISLQANSNINKVYLVDETKEGFGKQMIQHRLVMHSFGIQIARISSIISCTSILEYFVHFIWHSVIRVPL